MNTSDELFLYLKQNLQLKTTLYLASCFVHSLLSRVNISLIFFNLFNTIIPYRSYRMTAISRL